jgi:20S proteasome subunit beta 7
VLNSIEDRCADDGSTLDPSEIHAYLSRVMYGRRSKGDPLWNQVVVAGVKNGNTYVVFDVIVCCLLVICVCVCV